MKYAELSDEAKQRAREWYASIGQDHDWWQSTYEDAVECGKRLGIEIGTRGRKAKIDINFSGFHTQGSGCCFSGVLWFRLMEGAVAKIKEHAATEELIALAIEAERLHAQWNALRVKEILLGPIEAQDTLNRVNIRCSQRYHTTGIESDTLAGFEQSLSGEFGRFVSDFAAWIYSQLEAEDEHMNSTEYIEENIIANEYEFDEDGRI